MGCFGMFEGVVYQFLYYPKDIDFDNFGQFFGKIKPQKLKLEYVHYVYFISQIFDGYP